MFNSAIEKKLNDVVTEFFKLADKIRVIECSLSKSIVRSSSLTWGLGTKPYKQITLQEQIDKLYAHLGVNLEYVEGTPTTVELKRVKKAER